MEGVTRVSRFKADQAEDAAMAMFRDGAVIIEAAWPAEVIDEVRELIEKNHPDFAEPSKLADWCNNGEKRFISPVILTERMRELGLVDGGPLHEFFTAALEETYMIEAFGMTMARAGCPEQRSHRDGGVLFTGLGIDTMLPAVAFTVGIPLVDIDEDNGPTAIFCGTQRYSSSDGMTPDKPTLRRGDAIIWDFRVLHHGCENRTDADRPLLYLTVCRQFWVDHKNFKKGNRKLIVDDKLFADLPVSLRRAQLA